MPSSRPLIGVTCCVDRGKRLRAGTDYLYVSRAYLAALAQAGATPIMVGPDASAVECAERLDGLVISGGDDLPRRFTSTGGDWDEQAIPEDPERTSWERALLEEFTHLKRPVLGVCYGMQLLNLHWGGSLTWCSEAEHGGQGKVAHHDLTWTPSTSWLQGTPTRVNSSHRQAVDEVGAGATIIARAPDGTIECIARGRMVGVQWHPETDGSSGIYRSFVTACT